MFSAALKVRSVTSKIPKTSNSGKSDTSKTSNAKEQSNDYDSSDDTKKGTWLPWRRNNDGKEKRKWHRRINKKRCAVTWLIILLLGTVAGVLAYFFAHVRYAEYYEYGLMKLNYVGTIDPTWVYWNQWVTRGPNWGMITYPATGQLVILRNLSVGTLDDIEISLSLTFQYFLRRWDIPALHDTYRLNFAQPIVTMAEDSIKETTPQFDSRLYLTDRHSIEMSIFEALRWRLEGQCCLRECGRNHTRPCKEGCIERDICNHTDMGMFAEVKHFFLLGVQFPDVLQEAFMKTVVTNVTTETEVYLSQGQRIRAQTHVMVEQIQIEEYTVNKTAEIEANQTISIARSKYASIFRGARAKALVSLCDQLNITSEELKNSLEYSQILSETNSVHMNVDYQPFLVKFRNP